MSCSQRDAPLARRAALQFNIELKQQQKNRVPFSFFLSHRKNVFSAIKCLYSPD